MPRDKRDYYRKKEKSRRSYSPEKRRSKSKSIQKSRRSPERSSKHRRSTPDRVDRGDRDRHYSKSSSQSRRRSRSPERERRKRRSSSRSSSSSSSTSSSSSSSSNESTNLVKDFELMLDQKKADLNFFKSVDQLQSHHNIDLVDKINAEEFAPQAFKSQKTAPENILINLKSQVISVPKVEVRDEIDSLIHPNFLGGDDDLRMKKWVKKMYLHRQRLVEME